MSAIKTQQDILNAEFVWHGGYLSAPKVYDAGTSFSAPPALRQSQADLADDAGSPTGARRIRFDVSDEAWTVDFDAP